MFPAVLKLSRGSVGRLFLDGLLGLALASCKPTSTSPERASASAPVAASGPLVVDVPAGTQATELEALVRRALAAVPRTCWVIWGEYRGTEEARPIEFRSAERPDVVRR